jgi:hypothetical protein
MHLSHSREGLLEQMSLAALSTAARSGCRAMAPTPTSAALSAGTPDTGTGTLTPAAEFQPAAGPDPTAASPTSAGTSSSPVSSPGSSAVAAKPGSSRRSAASPTTISSASFVGRNVEAAVTSSQPFPPLALVIVALLLLAVLIGQRWRRGPLFPARAATTSPNATGGAPFAVAAAAPAPRERADNPWRHPPPSSPAAERLTSEPAQAPGEPASPSEKRWLIPSQSSATEPPRASSSASQRSTTPSPRGSSSPRPEHGPWLREHASQAALVISVLAGATRILARGLTRKSSRGQRRR